MTWRQRPFAPPPPPPQNRCCRRRCYCYCCCGRSPALEAQPVHLRPAYLARMRTNREAWEASRGLPLEVWEGSITCKMKCTMDYSIGTACRAWMLSPARPFIMSTGTAWHDGGNA